MVVKVKLKIEESIHVKSNDKSKMYISRGERNVRYHDKNSSNKKKTFNLTYFYNFATK